MIRIFHFRWSYSLISILALIAACSIFRPSSGEVVLGPGSFNYPDPRAGLADLSGYTSSLTTSFEGRENGQSVQWSHVYVMRYSKDPLARLLTIEGEPDQPSMMAEMNGAAYEVLEDGACGAGVLDPQNSFSLRMEPAKMISGVLGAEQDGQETINGIETDHYTFDERALAESGLAVSTGEMWVATDGGYIVRYLVTTTGDEKYFGEEVDGKLTREYELTEVNQPHAIELPATCPPGMIDAPLLTDATNILMVPGFSRYTTNSTPAEASAFYQEQLADLNWSAYSSNETPEGVSQEEYKQLLEQMQAMGFDQPTEPAPDADEVFLEFQQGDQILSLITWVDEGTTKVELVLSNATE